MLHHWLEGLLPTRDITILHLQRAVAPPKKNGQRCMVEYNGMQLISRLHFEHPYHMAGQRLVNP